MPHTHTNMLNNLKAHISYPNESRRKITMREFKVKQVRSHTERIIKMFQFNEGGTFTSLVYKMASSHIYESLFSSP